MIISAPDELQAELRAMSTARRVRCCARWEPGTVTDPASATRRALHLLARRWLQLGEEARVLEADIGRLMRPLVPTLLAEHGVGLDVAVKLVVAAGEEPGRLRSEASFAAMCGTSPIEASSGKNSRHRLNRGGNRQANNALHVVMICRAHRCTETRSYIERRTAEGKTPKEIQRCLKRHLARRLYHALLADLLT